MKYTIKGMYQNTIGETGFITFQSLTSTDILITTEIAGKMLALSKRRIQQLVDEGLLIAIKLDGLILVQQGSIISYAMAKDIAINS